MRLKRMRRFAAAFFVVAICAAAIPAAAFAENNFNAYVSSFVMEVYRDPFLGEYWGSLPQNTVVTVNSYASGVAQITYNGRTGYANVSDMRKAETDFSEDEEVSNAAKTTKKTRVYQAPNLASRYVNLPKGYEVNILETNGSCTRVERKGVVGYMYTGHLKRVSPSKSSSDEAETEIEEEITAEPAAPAITTLEQAAASGKYSNEQLLYMFAIKVLGYNSAAACALLGNCYFESGFSTASLSDGGTSYGLFQWHNGRWTSMRNWCAKNGYDYMTVVGQLYYLQHDLEKNYPKVHAYLKDVPNTPQGAYDGAYYFCTKFLIPANKDAQGIKRGNRAKDVYWTKYNGTTA